MVNSKLLYALPKELINIIITYTYSPQSNHLLEDIKHNYITKELLYTFYFNYWLSTHDEIEYKYWLFNDILGYTNSNQATMYGYTDEFYSIMSRNIILTKKQKIDKYIESLEHKPVDSLINIFWGLLTIQEREDFIQYRVISIQ